MVGPWKTTNWLPIWVYWSLFRGEPLLLNFGRVDIFKHLLKGSILSTLHATSVATGGQRFLRKSETSTGAPVELEEDDDEDGNSGGSDVFVVKLTPNSEDLPKLPLKWSTFASTQYMCLCCHTSTWIDLCHCFGSFVCCWDHPVRDREKKQESDSSSEDGDAAELEGMSEEEKFLGFLDQVLFSSGGTWYQVTMG